MNSQTNGYVQEIEYQTKMLHNIKNLIKYPIILTALSLFIILYSAEIKPLKILGVVFFTISILATLIIGLAIHNGYKNVNKVIDAYAQLRKDQ